MNANKTLIGCTRCGRGYPAREMRDGLCPECAPRVRYSAADECGFDDCPHAVPHISYWLGNERCTEPCSCQWWMQQSGIGAKRAMCKCKVVLSDAAVVALALILV